MIINVFAAPGRKLEKSSGYSPIVSYFWEDQVIPVLNETHDVKMYDAKKTESARDCEISLLITPYSKHVMKDEKVPERFGKHYWLKDRWVCISPTRRPDPKYNISFGVDKDFCYPNQSPYPTIIFQEFNRKPDIDDDTKLAYNAIRRLKVDFQDLIVYGFTVFPGSLPSYIQPITTVVPHKARNAPYDFDKHYLPWIEILEYYRKSWACVDVTPFGLELGKLECVACGNQAFMPKDTRQHPQGELNIVNNRFYSSEDELYNMLKELVLTWKPRVSQAIHEEVCEYFTWKRVADKVLKILEIDDGNNIIDMEQYSTCICRTL